MEGAVKLISLHSQMGSDTSQVLQAPSKLALGPGEMGKDGETARTKTPLRAVIIHLQQKVAELDQH